MGGELTTEDVTESMLCFRDAAVHVWNTYLRLAGDPMSEDIQTARDTIEIELIRTIVFFPFNISDKADGYRRGPLLEIEVLPKVIYNEVPVQIGDEGDDGNIYWSDTIMCKSMNFPVLNFIDFFDWDPYGHVNMASVRAASTVEGRTYLIEDMYCRFVLTTNQFRSSDRTMPDRK